MIYWLVFLSVFINYTVGTILNVKNLSVAALFVIALESTVVTAIFALLSWLATL